MPNLRILEPFQRGLRNDDNPTGVGALLDAYGVECRDTGLHGYSYVAQPLTLTTGSTVAKRHSLFTAAGKCFLFDTDEAFKEVSSSWGLTELIPVDNREGTIGAQLLTNYSFTSSGGWGDTLGGWTISSGEAYISAPSATQQLLFQTLSSNESCVSALLKIKVRMGPTTNAEYEAQAPLELTIGGSQSRFVYKTGTYGFIFTPSSGSIDGLYIFAAPGWTGAVEYATLSAMSNVTLTTPMPVLGWNIGSHPSGFICTGWDTSAGEGHPFYYDTDIGLFYLPGMHVAAVCEHTDGRLYMAGRLGTFLRADSGGYAWRRLADGSVDMVNSSGYIADNLALDERCIYWSCIGMDDVPGLFFPYLETNEEFLNRWERNEAGFMLWPYSGSVYRLLSLGEGVMAYGENGICFLKPSFSPITVSTFELGAIGLRGRMAVCGDGGLHYFLDREGYLWKVSPGPKLERLGYKEILSGLSASGTILVKHPMEDKLYISDETTSYMLSQGKLVECPEHVMSMVTFSNELAATVKARSDSFEAETGIFDFGSRDVKTLSRVTYDGFASSSGLACKVFYRMNRGDDWADTGWSTLPYEDRISAREFKFGVYGATTSSAYLTYLDVTYDNDPSRFSLGEWL